VNNCFEFVEQENAQSFFDDSLCGCYVIYSKKSLYYYIGYSSNIRERLRTHYLNLKSLYPSRKGDLFTFYIESCVKDKVNIYIEMGPVCRAEHVLYVNLCRGSHTKLYSNYFKLFLQKYRDYKLSLGEYFILELYTDLVGKILEQSLIYYYNPRGSSLRIRSQPPLQ
jgi:hypothetical protein